MSARGLFLALLAFGSMGAAGCKGTPCRTQKDCPFGTYCDFSGSSADSLSAGECIMDCESNSDCKQPASNISYAVCSNEGRCETLDHPPKLRILEPEEDAHYPEGTTKIRISGEVGTAAPLVTVSARAKNGNGCGGGAVKAVDLMNPNVGSFATLSFVLEDVEIDPGDSLLSIEAHAGPAQKKAAIDIHADCPGCAKISIANPKPLASAPALELPNLSGSIMPADVKVAIWRIFSAQGDVLDGSLPLNGGTYGLDRLPLFPGLNRIEVLVTGVGTGLGESRCSALVSAGLATESGLRLVLLGNDPAADLAIHLIGPTGHFGEAMTTLSPRSRSPYFGGTITDDIDGPAVATVDKPPDGVFGIIVEPVLDGTMDGSDAILHPLYNGRLATPRPIGPRHLTALDGKLWVVGTIKIDNGTATWTTIDTLVGDDMIPTTLPSAWPMFR